MLTNYRGLVVKNPLRMFTRMRHKINKESSTSQKPKVAQDVMNYLENSSEYEDIINSLPKTLLRKYKTPEVMYLINKKTAKNITKTLLNYIDGNAPVVEVNPGFGFLTRQLLCNLKCPIYLYETSNHFTTFLNDIQKENPTQIKLKTADFFGMWKLAFQDKMDRGNRMHELLGDLMSSDKDRLLHVIGATPSLYFIRNLIYNIIFNNLRNNLGRLELYISIPGYHYEFLTDPAVQKGKCISMPSLFQLFFDYEVLNKVPKVHYLPWTYSPNTSKVSMMDEYSLYLVRITQKAELPCLPDYLPLLWYFFKPRTFTKSTRLIPMLEQWIPGSGVWLITGQDPPDTNTKLSPGDRDAKLPHITIFTAFGDLSLQQKITVFKRLISWPEFEQCPFRTSMETHLQKFSLVMDDDKTVIGAHNDDESESSDTEIEPDP